jgi:hypothetical protein
LVAAWRQTTSWMLPLDMPLSLPTKALERSTLLHESTPYGGVRKHVNLSPLYRCTKWILLGSDHVGHFHSWPHFEPVCPLSAENYSGNLGQTVGAHNDPMVQGRVNYSSSLRCTRLITTYYIWYRVRMCNVCHVCWGERQPALPPASHGNMHGAQKKNEGDLEYLFAFFIFLFFYFYLFYFKK